MGTVPNPRTWVDGLVTPQDMDSEIRDPFNFLLARPAWALFNNAISQPIADGGSIYVSFDSVVLDNDGVFNQATNDHQVTIQTAGFYLIRGHIMFPANNAGRRNASFAKNGAALPGKEWSAGTGTYVSLSPTIITYCNVGDQLTFSAYQSGTGASLTPLTGGADGATFNGFWLSK